MNGKNKFSILMRSEMSGDMGTLFHMIMNAFLAAQYDFRERCKTKEKKN